MPALSVDGFQLSYQRRGTGPALLFLHSILTDSRVWRHQLDAFSDEFTVVAWDAPGCGKTDCLPQGSGMADYARLLSQFLDALELSSVHIAGAAWGSTLGLELYRLRPDLVQSLTLSSAYAGWKGSLSAEEVSRRLDRFRQQTQLPPEAVIGAWIPTFVTPGASKETVDAIVEMMREMDPYGCQCMAEALAISDHRPFLASVTVPVLVINGEADRRAPVAVARAIHESIPGSRMEIIPGAGHLPYLERPEPFNAALRAFLPS
ncbi:MAG: alpha/beta fold hydrolase [Thermomicrobiales bacterium]